MRGRRRVTRAPGRQATSCSKPSPLQSIPMAKHRITSAGRASATMWMLRFPSTPSATAWQPWCAKTARPCQRAARRASTRLRISTCRSCKPKVSTRCSNRRTTRSPRNSTAPLGRFSRRARPGRRSSKLCSACSGRAAGRKRDHRLHQSLSRRVSPVAGCRRALAAVRAVEAPPRRAGPRGRRGAMGLQQRRSLLRRIDQQSADEGRRTRLVLGAGPLSERAGRPHARQHVASALPARSHRRAGLWPATGSAHGQQRRA